MNVIPAVLAGLTASCAAAFFVAGFNWRRENCVWHSFSKKDARAAAVITLLYALLAFTGLGDSRTPESPYVFPVRGDSFVAELAEPAGVSLLRWYAGPTAGACTVEFSEDGESWSEQKALEQDYRTVLKWNSLETSGERTKYIRVTCVSGAPLYLTELAAFGPDGEQRTLTGGAGATDEQELAAAEPSRLNGSYFDEIYHVRTAWEHINGIKPYEITHPPLGKLIISLGIRLFGLNPFGWRFMGTLFGCLMLPVMYLLLKSMFGSSAAAAGGTVIFALDFMHFVQTRIATIDTYGVFFVLLMYACMYRYFTLPPDAPVKKTLLPLFFCGLFFGAGAASKWTVLYGGAGLAVIWLLRQIYCLRRRKDKARYLAATVLWSLLFFVLVPAAIYCLAYIPYVRAEGAKLFGAEHFRIILDNQKYMLNYHGGLTATHPYQSEWWQWVLDIRPILYYLRYFGDGTRSAFGAWGNPMFWWSGMLSMVIMVFKTVRGDKKAAFILCGWLSQLLPWVVISRCAFIYHYFPCTVFLAAAMCYVMCDIHRRSRKLFLPVAAAATGLCAGLFALFYPVLTGTVCSARLSALWRWFGGMWPF
ncbi:MAG: phospholipid carrier-dependent glycosyltransferase [Oscillospiraceae bacterium]|nr:phospholipid carrier-dependent glycosyltransferase [Oscillospiraceae bacterium]